ncbi:MULTISPECIES: FAD-binding oxidoreductase [unclassified Halomonas]|uniref:FAD-binding oxidoreductase n=1 Tax=Halomonas sp. RT37 TaxID=2950872 RepID=A0AAU7KG27_9GAMM|nr:FAD-binding oxidoreductase [Halomonas sp.]MCJ8287774.1 FAD-binding oxidoreductase [Halomonas sp.]NQY72494.1 FAD-binding oxidoreductase [Halomonas sp.]
MAHEVMIIGGGVVGMAVAYGLARRGRRVCVLDEHDTALKASRGNAGLVWVQGKGAGMPAYAAMSLASSRAWPRFAGELGERTGVDLEFEQPGGVDLCLDDDEVRKRCAEYQALYDAPWAREAGVRWEYLEGARLERLLPGLGGDVPGGIWTPHDGHCNPLFLLRALYSACQALGVDVRPHHPVASIDPGEAGFVAHTARGAVRAERLVLACGLGAARLAPPLGLCGRVTPVRGQVLVSERLPAAGRLPTPQIRQTASGGYLIGDVLEHVGHDTRVTLETLHALARRAVTIYPDLASARLVRSWAALRIMTPDGCPVYEASQRYPGAYNLSCHSGITLAAFHADELAAALDDDRLTERYPLFSGGRFDVQAA